MDLEQELQQEAGDARARFIELARDYAGAPSPDLWHKLIKARYVFDKQCDPFYKARRTTHA